MKFIIKWYGNKSEARLLRSFSSKKAARAWIMEGMFCTEGAERDHYVSMLEQLEDGETTLYYDDNFYKSATAKQYEADFKEAFENCSNAEEIYNYMAKKGWTV